MLADEPIASVDPARRGAILDALAGAGGPGTTLIASLHDVDAALGFPRVVGLRAGRVAFDLPPGEVDEERIESLYRVEEEAESWLAVASG